MRPIRSRWFIVLGLSVGMLLLAWGPVSSYRQAARLLERLSPRANVASTEAASVRSQELTIAGESGPIHARLYASIDSKARGCIVVAHGVHHLGIDERRLVPFVRALAESGLTVVTPALTELSDYRITLSGVRVIRDAVKYLAESPKHACERLGLLGFSFAGGLALVAAAEPETAGRLSFVTSVGGHHDLRRVLRFIVRNELETTAGVVHASAHEYGLVVLVYGNLEHFVPAIDLPPLRAGFRAWLREDRPLARRLAKPRTTAEAARLWQLLETQQLQSLAPALEALLQGQQEQLAQLSPAGRLHGLGLPVYLLHGAHDSVIPPSETGAASAELGTAAHRALISPLLDHVEVSGHAGVGDKLALVSFVAGWL